MIRKNWIWALIFVIGYVFVINQIPDLLKNYNGNQGVQEKVVSSGESVNIGVSDSVSILVERKRIYGRYYEPDGDIWLYLFYLVKLPVEIDETRYSFYHVLAVFVFILIILKGRSGKNEEMDKYINRFSD